MGIPALRFFLKACIIIAMMLPGAGRAEWIQGPPLGYLMPDENHSPNDRYTVIIPERGKFQEGTPANKILNIRMDEPVGTIRGQVGWNSMKYGRVQAARWSRDSSLLLWNVDGQFGPATLMLVKIEDDKIKWQVDLYSVVREAIMEATKKAKPVEFAEEVEFNAMENPEAPKEFAVDVYAVGNEGDLLNFPLKVHADLVSDPRSHSGGLVSQLNGTVDEDGKFKVIDFSPTAAKTLRNW